MSDEIYFGVFAGALRRRWWIVAIFVAAALVAAFVASAIQPKHYEAVATLTAAAPRLQWRFDTGIQPIVDTRREKLQEGLSAALLGGLQQRLQRLHRKLHGRRQHPHRRAIGGHEHFLRPGHHADRTAVFDSVPIGCDV